MTPSGPETGFMRPFDPAKKIWHPLSTANVIAPCQKSLGRPLCFKINPTIRQISPSSFQPIFYTTIYSFIVLCVAKGPDLPEKVEVTLEVLTRILLSYMYLGRRFCPNFASEL